MNTALRHPVSMTEAKRRAAESAEKRRQRNNNMMPSGGVKLGEGILAINKQLEKDLSPSQMAAMMAEKRAKDNIWCGETHKNQPQEIKNDDNSSYALPVESQNNTQQQEIIVLDP